MQAEVVIRLATLPQAAMAAVVAVQILVKLPQAVFLLAVAAVRVMAVTPRLAAQVVVVQEVVVPQ